MLLSRQRNCGLVKSFRLTRIILNSVIIVYQNIGVSLLMLLYMMIHMDINCINIYNSFIKNIKYMSYLVILKIATCLEFELNAQKCMIFS